MTKEERVAFLCGVFHGASLETLSRETLDAPERWAVAMADRWGIDPRAPSR